MRVIWFGELELFDEFWTMTQDEDRLWGRD